MEKIVFAGEKIVWYNYCSNETFNETFTYYGYGSLAGRGRLLSGKGAR